MLFLQILLYSCIILEAKAYTELSDNTLKGIPSPGLDFDIKTGQILAPILIPRVSGTEGSKKVQHHFVNWFSSNLPKWSIDFQNSTSTTPVGGDKQIPFTNIILTRDPPWAKPGDVGRLTLAAHYDSKYEPTGFIGAIDSAAPCAIILHAARSVDEAITKKWAAMEDELFKGLDGEIGIQIILLDGEEAFQSWTDTDSLYGSRSLAETWEASSYPALSTHHNPLGSISLFVLLDLLGAPGTVIPSYFETTHWAYKKLARIETRMRSLGELKSQVPSQIFPESEKTYFQPGLMIQDDHIPFMARGVEILHLIPKSFPSVWHTMADTGENLDIPSIEDWAKIVTVFLAEWMDLEGNFYFESHLTLKRDEL